MTQRAIRRVRLHANELVRTPTEFVFELHLLILALPQQREEELTNCKANFFSEPCPRAVSQIGPDFAGNDWLIAFSAFLSKHHSDRIHECLLDAMENDDSEKHGDKSEYGGI